MTILRHTLRPTDPNAALEAIVGRSEWAEQLRAVIRAVAPYSSGVLITGPSGTGKELVARAIHALSPRAGQRFIPVDCASITGPLFASHMFGHLKGAFTGASYNAVGCFRAADRGTIFLDEIGELDLDLQAKLLRVLQERVVVPVGSHDGSPVDVRIVAASNRDLQQEVAAGRFREDLYFRLNVVSIQTRPLRERGDDVELLADHILRRLAVENGMALKELSAAARRHLHAYAWPGNIRELENAIERAVLFSAGERIEPSALPGGQACSYAETGLLQAEGQPVVLQQMSERGRWLTAAEVERRHIERTLEHTGNNQSAAARLLGIDRHQLRRRMIEHGLLATNPSRRGRPALVATRLRKAA
jgi:DNA-binding NtrC family response regulator